MRESVIVKLHKMGIVYIALLFCSLLVSQPTLIGHVPGKIKYVIGVLITLIALRYSTKDGYLRIKYKDLYYFSICVFPYVLMLFYSIFQTLVLKRSNIISALTTNFYYIIPIMVMQSVIILLGERAVDYTFYAMAANYFLCILVFLYRKRIDGIVNFFKYATAPGSILETHELTLTMGMIVLYYLLFDNDNSRKRRWKLRLSTLIFLMGFKRIAILGLPIAVLTYFFVNRKSRYIPLINRKSRYTLRLAINVVSIGIFAASILYIYIIRNGYLRFLVETYDIQTMSRLTAYEYFYEYYKISPAFMGQGLGFVMGKLQLAGNQLFGIGDLHNDILKMNIELGFIGAILFFVNLVKFQTNRLIRSYGYKVGVNYFTLVVYTMLLCFTDNILRYNTYLIVLFMIPYVCHLKEKMKVPD